MATAAQPRLAPRRTGRGAPTHPVLARIAEAIGASIAAGENPPTTIEAHLSDEGIRVNGWYRSTGGYRVVERATRRGGQ